MLDDETEIGFATIQKVSWNWSNAYVNWYASILYMYAAIQQTCTHTEEEVCSSGKYLAPASFQAQAREVPSHPQRSSNRFGRKKIIFWVFWLFFSRGSGPTNLLVSSWVRLTPKRPPRASNRPSDQSGEEKLKVQTNIPMTILNHPNLFPSSQLHSVPFQQHRQTWVWFQFDYNVISK